MKRLALILTLLVAGLANAADFGRTTQGASWLTVEVRYSCTTITVTSGQTGVRVRAYLRSQGSATGGLKAAMYNTAGTSKVYESAELTSFTDTTGGWKDFTGGTITGAITADTYRLCAIGDAIAGGGNTVEIAYDTVGSDTSLYQYAFYGGTWPTLDADISGLFGATGAGTHNVSLYLETSAAGGGNAPRAMHHKRQVGHVIDFQERARALRRPKQHCTELRIAA